MVFGIGLAGLAAWVAAQGPAKPLYQNDFETAEVGKLPEDMMVMEGAFAVASDGANKLLELPGAPLDTFGVLFGPAQTAGLCVSARAYGTSQGRRFPTMAVGLNGVGGFKLQITPAKKLLELFKGDEVVATAPCAWESGTWTLLKLQVRQPADGQWRVEGKAWKSGGPEPPGWMLSHLETNQPPAGRAAIWASPFSGTPIRFDELLVTAASQ